jgi:hypothetical protein
VARKKKAEQAPAFTSRPAAEGTAVSVIVNNEERTLEAEKTKDGWAITPTDAAEATALAGFSDEALDPLPPPEPTEAPEPEPTAEESTDDLDDDDQDESTEDTEVSTGTADDDGQLAVKE